MRFEKEHGRAGLMIAAAVRYCLGRRTYIVGDCADWIIANWNDWPDNVKQLVQRDIEEEFERDARMPELKVLGDGCERSYWERVRKLWKTESNAETHHG